MEKPQIECFVGEVTGAPDVGFALDHSVSINELISQFHGKKVEIIVKEIKETN